MKIKKGFLLLLALLLAGCSNSAATPSQNFTWQIEVEQAAVKTALKTTEVVTLYNGNKDEVVHENTPSSGNEYLILKLKVNKVGDAAGAFNWKDVTVWDASGTSYPRLANDSFIEQHNYTPRMTGLTIRFGENEGWICFEIPTTAANGKLFLVHTDSEGQQKIQINP